MSRILYPREIGSETVFPFRFLYGSGGLLEAMIINLHLSMLDDDLEECRAATMLEF